MSRSAVVAAGAAIGYLVFVGLSLFGAIEVPSWSQGTVFAVLALQHLALGLLTGRWWAVLLPPVALAAAFLPFAPKPYEGPYVVLAVLAGIPEVLIVAVGVGVRKVAGECAPPRRTGLGVFSTPPARGRYGRQGHSPARLKCPEGERAKRRARAAARCTGAATRRPGCGRSHLRGTQLEQGHELESPVEGIGHHGAVRERHGSARLGALFEEQRGEHRDGAESSAASRRRAGASSGPVALMVTGGFTKPPERGRAPLRPVAPPLARAGVHRPRARSRPR